MKIDRVLAEKAFYNYVSNYDETNEKIRLKIEHTLRVAELCENIAESIGLNDEDINLAWILGLLHDVGRFEQIKRYGTFNDLKSLDHAKLGASILFDEGRIQDYIEDHSEDNLIRIVIESHNSYRIPEDISERCRTFSNILRDADKIDIFKVNFISTPEEIYNVSTEEIYSSEVTKEVMDSFRERDTILKTLKKTAVDNIVGHISLIFGLVYDESIKIVNEQKYLSKLLDFKSENHITKGQLDEIRAIVNEYIKTRI